MAKPQRPRKTFESLLALFAFLTLPWLPRPWLTALSRWLGSAAYRFPGRSRTVMLANLRAALGDRVDERRIERIAIESFQTMALAGMDVFWFGVGSARRIRKHVRCDESARDFFKPGAKIAVVAHFGNWEILGLAFSLLYEPCVSVAATLRNPFLDWMVRRVRQTTGQKVVPQTGAIRPLLRLLREGRTIAFANDQNTLPIHGGVFVDFFGLSAPVSRAPAGLYLKVRPDLAFVYGIADRRGDYTISARRLPEEYRTSDSIRDVSKAITTLVERTIRDHPGKWAWMYKRWKFIPENRGCEGFPAYARPIEPFEMKESR